MALLVALPSVATAQAVDDRPCLTEAEADTMVRFGLRDILVGGRIRCASVLSPSAFLRSDLKALHGRLRAQNASPEPEVNAIVRRETKAPVPPYFFATLRQLYTIVPVFRLSPSKAACSAFDAQLSKLRTQPAGEIARELRIQATINLPDPELSSYRICRRTSP